MEIKKEQLLEFGMIETTGDESFIFPMQKVISVANEDMADGKLTISLTNIRNQTELCLTMPEGILFLAPKTIDDLKIFEKCIQSYDPNY